MLGSLGKRWSYGAHELKHVMATEGHDAVPGGEEEAFPREIRLIAQALAFTSDVTEADSSRVHSVLSASYVAECGGTEAFRGGPALMRATVEALVADPCYRWVLVEAPNGHRAEEDGALLGACCYTTDGVSRKNGEVLSIRWQMSRLPCVFTPCALALPL